MPSVLLKISYRLLQIPSDPSERHVKVGKPIHIHIRYVPTEYIVHRYMGTFQGKVPMYHDEPVTVLHHHVAR